MRKTNTYNPTFSNNYTQPEEQDPFGSIPLSYRKQYDIPKFETLTSPRIMDNKFSFLDVTKPYKQQKQSQFTPRSPKIRDFLRHTTYISKAQSMVQKKKSQLTSSLIGTKAFKKSTQKKFNGIQKEVYSNQSSPVYISNFKAYGDQKYDKLASKVLNTASFIQQLKRFKQEKNKLYEPSKHSYITSETQKAAQSNTSNNIINDLFRKKLGQDFYTPKPQATTNAQKIKRGYTPNQVIKKVISPSHRKAVTIEDFILQTKLGGGKFGTVWKAFHVKTRSLFALKKIPKKMLKQNMMVDQFILEVKIQSFLKHENILQIYGVFDDQDNVYLILQFMEEGTLYSELKKKKKLTQEQTARKIKQVAKAIAYMHENGIVHRDIKPQNIVISGGVCKLCDFGWATICQDRRKTYCGTFDYAAPQILEGAQYDLSVDLWCLGVLTYQLMVGKAPFYHISRKQTISNILNVQNKKISFPNTVSQIAISFINCLLKKNPEQRLTYQQILNHRFLKQVEDDIQ